MEKLKAKIWDTPIELDGVKIKNRIVFPSIGTNWANIDGTLSEKSFRNYKTVSEGGCGIIITEATAISPDAKPTSNALCLYNKEHLKSLKILPKIFEKNNVYPAIQLIHAGGQANPDFTGHEPHSPSEMDAVMTGTGHPSRELEVDEIKEIKDNFIKSAVLAKKAGFKAIELHQAHGYLLHEFLSEHTNKRKDKYGGSIENRMRLVLEIIKGIQKEVPDITLGTKISGEDYLKDGLNENINKIIVPVLEKAGLKYFHVTAGIYETSKLKHEAMGKGEFFKYAKGIKNMVKCPVIGVGKVKDLDTAEKYLLDGCCDMVSIGRGQIADPHMVIKIKNNLPFNRCQDNRWCSYLSRGKQSMDCPQRKFD